MNYPLRALALTFLLTLSAFRLIAAEPEAIHYMTEDYAPSNYLENGKPKGIAVELLKAMWARMGVAEQPIQVLPWARAYATILEEPNRMLFAMTRSAEREPFFKWVGPIYSGHYVLYSDAKRPIVLKDLAEAKKYRIGVVRADFSEKDLLAKGFPSGSLYPLDSVQALARMLFIGRVDLLYLYEDTLSAFAPAIKATNADFYPSLVVSENMLYYALSKGTDDALVARFQKALDELEDARREIVNRYRVMP